VLDRIYLSSPKAQWWSIELIIWKVVGSTPTSEALGNFPNYSEATMADIENVTSKQNLARGDGSVYDYSVLVMLNNYAKYIDIDIFTIH